MSDRYSGGFVRNRSGAAESAGAQVAGGLLLTGADIPHIENCLGAVTIFPGVASAEAVKHETSEVMYVAAGRGELRTDDGVIPFAKGDAIFIPAGEWHWLINTGAEDLVSVFSFPRPDRPPTQTRSVRASGTA